MVSSLALCSRRPRFTSLAGDRAFWLGLFLVFLSFERQTPGSYRPITSQPLPSTCRRIHNLPTTLPLDAAQGVPGGKVNILGGHGICHSKQEKLYLYICPIPKGFRDGAISLYSTLYTVQTNSTPCPHTSCKVHWCWRWSFLKCIRQGKLYQLCHLNNKYRY
jgi:hypothetical protein